MSWMTSVVSRARRRELEAQLPSALDLFANSVRAGLSFAQAMRYVADQSPPPLAAELSQVLREHQLGFPFEEALRTAADRLGSEDVELMVTAILMTKRSGGNLAVILQRLAATIRERQQLRHQLQVLTSQGRLSGWVVGVMPLVLLAILAVLDPGYLTPMLASPWGWALLAAGAVMEAVGALVIRRIVTLEV